MLALVLLDTVATTAATAVVATFVLLDTVATTAAAVAATLVLLDTVTATTTMRTGGRLIGENGGSACVRCYASDHAEGHDHGKRNDRREDPLRYGPPEPVILHMHSPSPAGT